MKVLIEQITTHLKCLHGATNADTVCGNNFVYVDFVLTHDCGSTANPDTPDTYRLALIKHKKSNG